jgi:hypothetical protein
MKPEDQIKALAELDGCSDLWVVMKRGLYYRPQAKGYTHNISEAWVCQYSTAKAEEYLRGDEPVTIKPAPCKPYLTSYDAIIPLIQKQPLIVKQSVAVCFMKDGGWSVGDDLISATPSQLCEAVLRTTGKWKE